MPVRATTFDLWFTLFTDEGDPERRRVRIEAFAEATGAPKAAVAETLATISREFQRHHIEQQRTLGPHDAVRMACAALGVTVTRAVEQELTAVFAEAILQFPPPPIRGALDAVRAAAERGPVGVISDTGMSPGRSLRVLLKDEGFLPYLGGLVFSDEEGVSKPRAHMFERAASQLGVLASELVHIGDTEKTDIEGACGVGAKAILFTQATGVTGQAGLADPPTRAHYRLASWQGFRPILAELFGGQS